MEEVGLRMAKVFLEKILVLLKKNEEK